MTSSNGNIFRVTDRLCGEFPSQRPLTRSFDVFFDLRLNKRLSKQSWGWWFEKPSWSLWRHCSGIGIFSYFNTGMAQMAELFIVEDKAHLYCKIQYRGYW